jgi:hypothetical protein
LNPEIFKYVSRIDNVIQYDSDITYTHTHTHIYIYIYIFLLY